MYFKLLSVIVSGFILFNQAMAASDPVSWQMSPALENPTFTGRTYTMTYIFTSQLPVAMVKPLRIDKQATNPADFSFTDNCTGLKLQPQQSCTVTVVFTPVTAGNKSLQLIIAGYDNNQVKLPLLTTTTSGVASPSVFGTVSQAIPADSTVGESDKYNFVFTNNSSDPITNVTANVTQTTGTPTFTSTCPSTLSPGETCSVSGTFIPTTDSPNVQTVTATLNYDPGLSASVSSSTSIAASSGVVASFVDSNYLPAVMVGGGSSLTLWFLFTNNGPNSVHMTSVPVTVPTGSAVGTVTPVVDHCTGSTLGIHAACDVKVSFQATTVASPTQVVVNATANYTGGSSPSTSINTSTTVVASLSTSRTLTFVNNCSFPVWFSLNGSKIASSPSCTTDANCPSGTSCSSLTKQCYWKNYAPNTSGGSSPYKLDQSGGAHTSTTVTIPFTATDPAIHWSGNFSASLGCDGTSSCAQAACSNQGGSVACAAGQGFLQPATQAEITMNKIAADSYDVEVINGFHIPISMVPTQYVTPNNYDCGNAGDFVAENGFGSCNWATATPPGNGYYLVTSGPNSCNISAPSCTTVGQICGLDLNLNQRCGNFLGYWTSDQVCSMNTIPAAVKSYFSCATPLANLSKTITFPKNAVLFSLMACPVPKGDVQPTYNSCYLKYPNVPANNQLPCCGCVDWWTLPGIASNPKTQSCQQAGRSSPQTDPVWNSYIQPGVAWLKKACPSAYVYPFDDKASTFSCTNTLPGQANSVGYTITFCAGNTGLPSGKTEGRG